MEWWADWMEWLSGERLASVTRAAVLMIAGFALARLAAGAVRRFGAKRLSTHTAQLARRVVHYGVLILFALSALRELGFSLNVLLGAAGVFTVAIGFASQTSASNLISGLFLLAERPFSVGDVIQVGSTLGEVLAIDLLSVKLRTFDNLFVRIPNETLIKAEITTLTRFPIRRLDVKLGVAYKEDMKRVRDLLFAVADANPLCLEEPKPLFIHLGFGESSMDLQFSIWARRESFLDLRNTIHIEIKEAFDAAGIEIPFPHRSLYTGEASAPFPIRIVDRDPPAPTGGIHHEGQEGERKARR
ncbi:mechanosensitive ion channel family protein [Endothiovibrio diazotrophicus]